MTGFVTAAWEAVRLQTELLAHRLKRNPTKEDLAYDRILVARINSALVAMRASHPT